MLSALRLAVMSELAIGAERRGEHGEAERMTRETLGSLLALRGETHFETLREMGKLASLLMGPHTTEADKVAEGYETYLRVLELKTRTFGERHPSALHTRGELGMHLARRGRLVEAEPHLRAVYDGRVEMLGQAHPDALCSLDHVALCISDQGRHGEAEALHRQAYAMCIATCGVSHPQTLTVLHNLGVDLRRQGRHVEMEPLYREALDTVLTLPGTAAERILQDMSQLLHEEKLRCGPSVAAASRAPHMV